MRRAYVQFLRSIKRYGSRRSAKKQRVTEFLNWMLTDGQKMTEALAYARLPPEVIAMEKKAIEQIQ